MNKSILEEKNSSDLCLYFSKGSKVQLILFDRSIFAERVQMEYTNSKYKNEEIEKLPSSPIVGMISLIQSTKCGFFQVSKSVAKKGYGPLLYDLAASLVWPNYITSDRASVSPKAQNVWKYMIVKRRDDFDVQPINNVDCKYSKFGDESEFLDFKFKIKDKLDFQDMISNSMELFSELTQSGIPASFIKEELVSLAEKEFAIRVD